MQQAIYLVTQAGKPFTLRNAPPATPVAKTPVYSNVRALTVAGDVDPWCRPYYNRIIQHTMPGAQVMIVHDNGHGARY